MIQAEKSAADRISRCIDEQLDSCRSLQTDAHIDVQQLRGGRVFILQLKAQAKHVQNSIREHEVHLDRERAVMIKASVDLKAIEKLKQRRYERFLDDQRHQQARQEDEQAIQKFRRTRRSIGDEAPAGVCETVNGAWL